MVTMLADHKQIDKRTTMKNQNRSAALGRQQRNHRGGGLGTPATKPPGGGGLNQPTADQPSLAAPPRLPRHRAARPARKAPSPQTHPPRNNSTSRYLDGLLNIDNNFFDSMVNHIYPTALQFNKANVSDTEVSFLDLKLDFC